MAANAGGGGAAPLGVPERVLWSYIVQIASALKTVHNSGAAVRNLDPNRIIVTGKNRVRIAGCGVMDVLAWDGGMQHAGYQVRTGKFSHRGGTYF